MKKYYCALIIFLSTNICGNYGLPAIAQDGNDASKTDQQDNSKDNQTKASKQQIELVKAQLNVMGDTISKIKHVLGEIHDEVNRHKEVLLPEPFYFGDPYYEFGTHGQPPADPYAYDNFSNGPVLPPRKDRLDEFMQELSSELKVLINQVNSIDMNRSFGAHNYAEFTILLGVLPELNTLLGDLNDSTQEENPDNVIISRQTKTFMDNIKGMDKTRKELHSRLK